MLIRCTNASLSSRAASSRSGMIVFKFRRTDILRPSYIFRCAADAVGQVEERTLELFALAVRESPFSSVTVYAV